MPIARIPQRSPANTTMMRFPATSSIRSGSSACLLALALIGFVGCYDGQALLAQAQSKALNASLAEVDLGTYRTTLPRDPETGRYFELNVHIFGTVPRSRLAEAKKIVRGAEFRVRQETLAAVRQCSRDELTDPALAQLRARIEEVVNRVLAEAPLKEVGFYQLTVR